MLVFIVVLIHLGGSCFFCGAEYKLFEILIVGSEDPLDHWYADHIHRLLDSILELLSCDGLVYWPHEHQLLEVVLGNAPEALYGVQLAGIRNVAHRKEMEIDLPL